MVEASERRAKLRIIVGPEHTISFIANGHAFHNVRITNLSVEGCFATVHRRDASLFSQGSLLEDLVFEHPDLPRGPLTGHVAFALGEPSGRAVMQFIGLGIHFAPVPAETAEALERYITTHQPR